MTKFWESATRWLIAVIAFMIPFDHKYDKPLRFLSAKLIPTGLSIPPWFEKRLSYYTSDVLVLILLIVVLVGAQRAVSRLLVEKGTWLLWIIVGAAILSIYLSSFSGFPIPYIRVSHLSIAAILYGIIATMEPPERNLTVKWVLTALVLSGSLQSVIAIAQYFHQGSIGLRFLGEPFFYPSDQFPIIVVGGSKLWFFSKANYSSMNFSPILRAIGTFSHPNILGGFLTCTGLVSLYLFSESKGRIKLIYGSIFVLMLFAMTTTYSRAAFFGLLLGAIVWVGQHIYSRTVRSTLSALIMMIVSISVVGFLFHEQIYQRGGVISSTKLSQGADKFRLSYQSVAFRMMADHPLTGVGYGQFNIESPKYFSKEMPSLQNRSATHNIYLLVASEMGIPALLAYLSFIFFLLWKSIRSPQTPLISIFTAIFFAFLFIGGCDFYLILFQQGRIMFFLVAGLLASQFWVEKRSENLNGLPSLQGQ